MQSLSCHAVDALCLCRSWVFLGVGGWKPGHSKLHYWLLMCLHPTIFITMCGLWHTHAAARHPLSCTVARRSTM